MVITAAVQTVVTGCVSMATAVTMAKKKAMATKAVDGGRSSGEIAGLDESLAKAAI